MTIAEFLEENVYNLTTEEYNQALADLETLDNKEWIDRYSSLMQEKTAGWNKVDEVKKAKPLAKRIADAFADSKFSPGKAFKDDVYQDDFSDVPREKFEEALSKMKSYYDQEVAQRKADADKEKRKREVKNWGWRNFLASDYEKERYIDNPQAALFGEQATPLSQDWLGKGEAISDLAYGASGAVADALPGWAGMIGPAVRTARDVQHVVTGSPYQKTGEEIGRDFIADAGLTASTAWLPNFRQQKRMLGKGGMMPSNVGNILGIENEAKNIRTGAFQLLPYTSDKLPIDEATRRDWLRKAYVNMPESQLKKDLAPIMSEVDIDWSKLNAIVSNNFASANAGLTRENRNAWRQMFNAKDESVPIYKVAENLEEAEKVMVNPKTGKEYGVKRMTTLDPLSKRILETDELTKAGEKLKPVFKAADSFLGGNTGGAALQLGKTASGTRSPYKAKRIETPEERDEIEEIKKREAPFWEIKFKPKKDESLLYKAWLEYAEEHGLEDKD